MKFFEDYQVLKNVIMMFSLINFPDSMAKFDFFFDLESIGPCKAIHPTPMQARDAESEQQIKCPTQDVFYETTTPKQQ